VRAPLDRTQREAIYEPQQRAGAGASERKNPAAAALQKVANSTLFELIRFALNCSECK